VLLFPSPQWVAAWAELANADQAFRSAGAGWDGAVGGVIEADAAAGVSDSLYLRLTGRDGRWHEHALAADDRLVAGTVFTIRAPYGEWKSVIRAPVAALRQSRRRLAEPAGYPWHRRRA